MTHGSERDVADLLASLREDTERRAAESNPQGAVNLLRSLPETVAVSDSVSYTETPASDAKMDWSADAEWGFVEW